MRDPARALAGLLDGPGRWHTLDHRAEVGSTNDVALASLAAGMPPGVVVVADRQTAGRGRRGRTWEDRPDGASLLVSVTLAAPGTVTLVPLAAGLAVADAAASVDVEAVLKWPNDVLVRGAGGDERKLAGVLAEGRPAGLVLGVGVNVDLRSAPVAGATSVAGVLGRDVDRWALLAELLRALDRWLGLLDEGRTDEVLRDYRARCATLGRDVVAELAGGGEVRGRASGVTGTGALVVTTPDGERVTVSAGDVHHVR